CGLTGLATGLLWWLASRAEGGRRTRWVVAMAGLAGVELLTYARAYRPTFEMAEVDRHVADYRRATALLQPDERALAPNESTVLLAGGLDVWGEDPMVLARYARFVAAQQRLTVQDLIVRKAFQFVTPGWSMLRLRLI